MSRSHPPHTTPTPNRNPPSLTRTLILMPKMEAKWIMSHAEAFQT